MIGDLELSESSYDEQGNHRRIAALRKAGVVVWSTDRVFIGTEVPLNGIEAGAVLMNAVLRGKRTAIGTQSKIGLSGTAVLVNTQIGRGVELGAGSYHEATLFDRTKVRGFAELRQGTVLEESSETGHNVGLKHTLFTTGVVAGSCINFCDVLVTGGSSRQDHSEIGSGSVHLNFDPHGAKFGSLVGDARGLLLRQRRIFIGGNSAVVAPVHIGFGAVVAAGTTVRKNLEPGRVYVGEPEPQGAREARLFDPDVYYDLRRKFAITAALCGNLQAVETWYKRVRLPFASGLEGVLCEGAIRNIRVHVQHRVCELEKLISKLVPLAKEAKGRQNPFHKQHLRLIQKRDHIVALLAECDVHAHVPPGDLLRRYRQARISTDHGTAIREMPERTVMVAEAWLADIASRPSAELGAILDQATT